MDQDQRRFWSRPNKPFGQSFFCRSSVPVVSVMYPCRNRCSHSPSPHKRFIVNHTTLFSPNCWRPRNFCWSARTPKPSCFCVAKKSWTILMSDSLEPFFMQCENPISHRSESYLSASCRIGSVPHVPHPTPLHPPSVRFSTAAAGYGG